MATASFKLANTATRFRTARPGFIAFGRSWRKRKATSHRDHHSPFSMRHYRCGRNPVLPRWRRAASRVARRVQKARRGSKVNAPQLPLARPLRAFTSPISDRSAICGSAPALFGLLNKFSRASKKYTPETLFRCTTAFYVSPSVSAPYEPTCGALSEQFI